MKETKNIAFSIESWKNLVIIARNQEVPIRIVADQAVVEYCSLLGGKDIDKLKEDIKRRLALKYKDIIQRKVNEATIRLKMKLKEKEAKIYHQRTSINRYLNTISKLKERLKEISN